MPPLFCFIDDSAFELDVFASHVAPAARGVDLVTGSTYEQVKLEIGDRYPCLFLLDLYGRDPDLADPELPGLEDLASEAASIGTLAGVYDGLDDFEGDRTNEFLKRLFQVADGWRGLFYRASRQAGQSLAYGLGNLAAARRDFPGAAMAAYTRKSVIADAVEVLAAGVDGLFLKPNGPTDDEIRRITDAEAPGLVASWAGLVSRKQKDYLRVLSGRLLAAGLAEDAARLPDAGELSLLARETFGPGDTNFLAAVADWRNLSV